MPSTTGAAAPPREASVEDIAAFMRGCSFEATRPTPKDVAALGAGLPRGAPVYLTMLPGRPAEEMVSSARAIRAAGLVPTPHLAARHFASMDAIDDLLARLAEEADVDAVLLIGGDTAKPDGSVRDALSVIESGVFQKRGVRRVGLPGFPDGHPAMDAEEIEANLVTKLVALQAAGLEAEIVTQFGFDARPILKWFDWLYARGLHTPVRIGLAGPTSLMTWLNFARKCGVKASAEALASRSGLIKQAFRSVAPDPLIRTLAGALASGRIVDARPHLFCFGGIPQTVHWAEPAWRGAIRLNGEGGFDAV